MNAQSNPPGATIALGTLVELCHRARHAASGHELRFMAVNDTHVLAPYRQAALWRAAAGVECLSGVVQVETNAPYVLWLDRVCRTLATRGESPALVSVQSLDPVLADEWSAWIPEHALWISLSSDTNAPAGILLARDLPWTQHEISLLAEWMDVWRHALAAREPAAPRSWRSLLFHARGAAAVATGPWWRQRRMQVAVAIAASLLFPVRLTVLAPGELVPAHPSVIRAPLDGVIETFHVEPNQAVRKGQPLFGFDEALIRARLEVARQSLATAETEYRQAVQQALFDAESKGKLAMLAGSIEEKRTDVAFLAEQLGRAQVPSPQDGIALLDDPSEWAGRPVAVGERIMRVASPGDVEVEAWVPVADAIPLEPDAVVSLYLNATPMAPVSARLRYLAHDATQRPDGNYAYRMRATLEAPTEHRVGLKGTAKLRGRWVCLGYWIMRRPLASLRGTLGW